MDANAELAKLQQLRSDAAARVSDLERDWRQAAEQARLASAALAEVERSGAGAPTRHKAEESLAAAKQRAGQPWSERVEGARAAARDVDRRYRTFVAEHLGELVEALEADGRIAAERVNAAAADLVAAHSEWERVAGAIGTLVAQIRRPAVGDVSYPKSQSIEASRAAIALVNVGGEEGPMLTRTGAPWAQLLSPETEGAQEPEPVAAA